MKTEQSIASFEDLHKPTKLNLLVGFCDIARFLDVSSRLDSLELFDLLDGMAKSAIRHFRGTSGRIIKFIGDGMLVVFPEESVDEGVIALLDARRVITEYFRGRGFDIQLHFGVHFGEVVIGPFGEKPQKALDVFGDNVNRAAMLTGRDYKGKFVITPQAFRALEPETRKRFRKFAQPIVYIGE